MRTVIDNRTERIWQLEQVGPSENMKIDDAEGSKQSARRKRKKK